MVMLSTIQILTTILIDYSLHWLLLQVRFYGRQIKPINSTELIMFEIIGQGVLAEMYKGIIESLSPYANVYAIDVVPCLPNPINPNYVIYNRIFFILGLVWILLILEPYGLRFRQRILEYFYPKRAKERAIWLYNEIMGERKLFLQMARKKARKRFLKDKAGTRGESFLLIKMWKKLRNFCTVFKYKCKICRNSFTS